MSVIGQPRSYYKKFKFVVEIDSFTYSGFQKCSELSMEVGKIEHREGGRIIPDKSPGLVTFADLTLERGATKDRELWNWMKQVADVAANGGLVDDTYKRNIDIVQRERDDSTLVRWRVYRAWPLMFVAGEWDNDADENVIEKVTLTYDFFEPIG